MLTVKVPVSSVVLLTEDSRDTIIYYEPPRSQLAPGHGPPPATIIRACAWEEQHKLQLRLHVYNIIMANKTRLLCFLQPPMFEHATT